MDFIPKESLVQYLGNLQCIIGDCHKDYTDGVEGCNFNDDVYTGAMFVVSNILANISGITHSGIMITDKTAIKLAETIVEMEKGGADNDTCRENQTV